MTVPYRRCEAVCRGLLREGIQEISQSDLRRIISKYCASSPKMILEYEQRFVEYGFLREHMTKPSQYLVNQRICFPLEDEVEDKDVGSNVSKESGFSDISNIFRSGNQHLASNSENVEHQSKTGVYLDKSPRVPFSVKVRRDLKECFVERVKSLGLDCCYAQEAWMGAFLIATEKASELVQVPVQLGLSTLIVNLIMPYVVSKPRRHRKHITIDEEELVET